MQRQMLLNKDKDDDVEIKTTIRISKRRLKIVKKLAIDESLSMAGMLGKLIDDYANAKRVKR